MKTIYKYPLDINKDLGDTFCTVELPKGAIVRKVAYQASRKNMHTKGMYVWAEITPNKKETENVLFMVVGTGHVFGSGDAYEHKYIDTLFDDYGYVWHVYQSIKK